MITRCFQINKSEKAVAYMNLYEYPISFIIPGMVGRPQEKMAGRDEQAE